MASRKGAARGAASSRGRAAPKKKTKQSDAQALGGAHVTSEAAEAANPVEAPADAADPAEEVEPAPPDVTEAEQDPASGSGGDEPAELSESVSAEVGSEDALPLDAALDAGDEEEPGIGSEPPLGFV